VRDKPFILQKDGDMGFREVAFCLCESIDLHRPGMIGFITLQQSVGFITLQQQSAGFIALQQSAPSQMT
jgi:hypothetical protein